MTKFPTETWLEVLKGYQEGWSDVEVMRYLGLTKSKFYDLLNDDHEAKEFVEMGRVLAEAWWMELGRKNVKRQPGEIFDGSLYSFITKNRFGWADKIQQLTEDPMATMSDDDLKQKFAELLQDKAKELGKTPTFSVVMSPKPGK